MAIPCHLALHRRHDTPHGTAKPAHGAAEPRAETARRAAAQQTARRHGLSKSAAEPHAAEPHADDRPRAFHT